MTSGTKNHQPTMALGMALALLLAAPFAQAAPLRGYAYSPQQAPRPAIAVAQAASSAPVGAEITRIAALMQQCESALTTAHPWRAAQAQREMFQLKVSMSYRVAAGRLSPQDISSARAIEARAFGNLAATCAPLLV